MMRFGVVWAFIIFFSWANTAHSQSGSSGGGGLVEQNSANLVRETKRLLYLLNYDVGTINNSLDFKARIAIRKVQRKLDIDVTGKPSRALVEILRRSKKSTIWGAISATTSGSYGSAWNFKSRRKAERRALQICRKNSSGKRCSKPITATRSSCIALATYSNSSYKGYLLRVRRTFKQAMNSALSGCRAKKNSKGNCNIRTYICADGSHK